jgi:serine/threonine protein kinase
MPQCSVCSAELTGSGVRCPSCGASLTVAHPTLKQPPAASGGWRKSSNSTTTTTSSGQGSFISGTVLDGRYRIVALLGRGGMGEVYKAEDLKLDHEVALKFLPESFARDAAGLTRFRTEVRIARQLSAFTLRWRESVCSNANCLKVDRGGYFISLSWRFMECGNLLPL